MTVWKCTQVSKEYWSMRLVSAICCATDWLLTHFRLYLSAMSQVVQERWRRCLGSQKHVLTLCKPLENSRCCLCLGISPSVVYKWFNKKHVNTMGYAPLYCGKKKKSMTQWVNMLWNLLQKILNTTVNIHAIKNLRWSLFQGKLPQGQITHANLSGNNSFPYSWA